MKIRSTAVTLTAIGAVALATAGCTSDVQPSGDSQDQSITFWVQEDLPDRVAAAEKIVSAFESESGVSVEVVPVAEDQFAQLITSAAAADDLPDVIGALSLPQVRTLSANQLIDAEAVAGVVDSLDASTFSAKALALTADGDQQLAVPSESWLQMLFYRTDLFEKAGLPAPDSYESILAAAKALDSEDVAGFVGATAPGDAFTEQTFEQVALGNNCQLVNDAGEIEADSSQCVESFGFYGDLISNYSVPGAQDVDTTRASYFAGDAAMFIWSSFVLDEMAGLRNDAMPTCAECADNPAFLAENTGVVTSIAGPDSSGAAQFGEITSWTITDGANVEASQAFIEYMMSTGYEDWIAIAPEGKVPVRFGTAEEPTAYSDAWATFPVGVDTKAPLADFYSPEVLEAVAAGPENIARWAIPQGQGDLLGALQGEQPVATAVSEVTQGGDATEVAATAAETARSVQESIK